MLLRPFLNGASSCASYLFGCGTHAELAVVDPHAEDAGPTGGGRRSDGLLFPYPGTDRLWTESEYRNWREDYFVPIARGHGLGSESDDPYALRHIYATLRIAAHHPTLYIESSMGTGLVGRVYGGVIRRYEGRGPLNIDAEIRTARRAAASTEAGGPPQ
jgi:hypothetical protein